MAIKTVVTAGFGNGTFLGTVKDIVLRGFTIGTAGPPISQPKFMVEMKRRVEPPRGGFR
ncbi:MAG: hypothetical protein BMS9Abin11_1749 [Gammaproteobacteria bacterium]|nr:MAG: hypothetical protein BMS9Abin11_1749 [Gammaproteobacteria bacterium]